MESRGRVMVPVPAHTESGIQGPAQTFWFIVLYFLLSFGPSQNILDNAIYKNGPQPVVAVVSENHPYVTGCQYRMHIQIVNEEKHFTLVCSGCFLLQTGLGRTN